MTIHIIFTFLLLHCYFDNTWYTCLSLASPILQQPKSYYSKLSSNVMIISSFSDLQRKIQENSFSSCIILPCESSSTIEYSIARNRNIKLQDSDLVSDFDHEISIVSKDQRVIEAEILQLLPKNLHFDLELQRDILQLILAMQQDISTTLVCRLALMSYVRCPKWHEDYVNLRLVKTYYGQGMQWCDPGRHEIRMINSFRSLRNLDLLVPSQHTLQMETNDVMIMSGRNRKDNNGNPIVPVLHRSPQVVHKHDRRLLFTITIA